jgi:hypothetical protein
MKLTIRQAITMNARAKPNYAGIRVPVLAIYQAQRPFEEVAAKFDIRNEQERAALRQGTRQRAPCTQDGNRIFARLSPRLESSNCPALISTWK